MDINFKDNKDNNVTFSDRIIFLLYFLYFIFKPFYFWSSGLPQVSDIFMVLLIMTYIFKKKGSLKYYYSCKKNLLIGLIFVAYIFFINLIWMMLLNYNPKFITVSLFYLYNFLIFFIVITLYFDYEDKIIEVTYRATLISLLVQLVNYIVQGGFLGGRIVAGFNNPNQLGYYALLSLSILLLCSQRIKISLISFILGLSVSALLCFLSLSKAAMLSYMGMLISFILFANKNKKFKRNFIIILMVFTGVFYYAFNYTDLIKTNRLFLSVQRRINSIGNDSDDSLEGRGYTRITEHPEYWIFGAGEGEYNRFEGLKGSEFHSTLGNIQVSYGIIGSLLFINFILAALKNDKYKSWYIIVFILVYGLTHNGIRNSVFWILLAMISTSDYEDTLQSDALMP